jgi:hypothetical protein
MLMRKLAILSALLLALSLAPFWSQPAMAYVYPPCDQDGVCPTEWSTGNCSCPLGTFNHMKNTTCDQWIYFCYGC